MPGRRHYQSEDEAVLDVWNYLEETGGGASLEGEKNGYSWSTFKFVGGALTVLVPFGYVNDEPRILLRENEGLYWEVPDA